MGSKGGFKAFIVNNKYDADMKVYLVNSKYDL